MLHIFFGILVITNGVMTLIWGAHEWRGVVIPAWTGWPQLLLGVAVLIIAIRGIRRNKGKSTPKGYTTEEIAQSKAELEAMHLRDHGKPTEDSGKER